MNKKVAFLVVTLLVSVSLSGCLGRGGNIGEMHHHNGNLYFAGEDNWTGIELWRLLFSREVTYV